MTRIIKTISLDETTNEIAKSLPNFSGFIRAKLLEHARLLLGYYWACWSCDQARSYKGHGRPKLIPYCFLCGKDMTELTETEYIEATTKPVDD